jgi:hypothetical protein
MTPKEGTDMEKMEYEMLTEIQGRLEAELLESYLEANGVDVELIQESVGHSAYPVTIDGLGRVQVFVPKAVLQSAKLLLKDFQEGSVQEEL